MIQSIKRAALVLAALATGYVCIGVPEAHSSAPATEVYLVSQAPEELTGSRCTAEGCARACSPNRCMSFRENATGGCNYNCEVVKEKSPSEVK